jgi:hypothetical protein
MREDLLDGLLDAFAEIVRKHAVFSHVCGPI